MDKIKSFFSFLNYTLFGGSGGPVVYGGSAGSGVASQNVTVVYSDPFLSFILPYVPVIGICVAILKLVLDFYRWKVERGDIKSKAKNKAADCE